LIYPHKEEESRILSSTPKAYLESVSGITDSNNKLIWGENLNVLQTLLTDYRMKGKINLVYIDPPFSTNGSFTFSNDRTSTVSKSLGDNLAYSDILVGAEYLEFIRQRLILLKELMSPSASIYLHIDYKVGHYIKIIMDEIFGSENYRNDISRIKCNPKNFSRKGYGNIKDMILFYSKTEEFTWNPQYELHSEEDAERLFKKVNRDGRKYTTIPLHAPGETRNGDTGKEWRGIKPPKGRHWRSAPSVFDDLDDKGLIEWSKTGVPRRIIFADESKGKLVQDIWEFKDLQYPTYPTEKNLDLLRHIIKASSNENDYILDCFCGSGTTLQAAHELNRKWIGIDKSEQAIKIVQQRFTSVQSSLFNSNSNYELLKQTDNPPLKQTILPNFAALNI